MNNLFFATKVSFLNEMKLLADKVGANWSDAVEGFILDGRIDIHIFRFQARMVNLVLEEVVSLKIFKL